MKLNTFNQSLYSRIDKKILAKIKEEQKKYPVTVGLLIDALKNEQFVCELKYTYIIELKSITSHEQDIFDIFEDFDINKINN